MSETYAIEGNAVANEPPVDDVFSLLDRVAQAFAATVGPLGEAVVHDLRQPERSVIAIYGDLTHRQVGAPTPSPELLPENVDRYQEDSLGREIQTPFGRTLTSSSVWVRDASGHIVGALCLNADLSGLKAARDELQRVLDGLNTSPLPGSRESFARSTEDFVTIAVNTALAEIGKPLHQLSRRDRIELVRRLDETGVFSLRHAADTTAGQLGVSRGSIYGYLREARSNN
jgi:predicted transcriptional regulator YheO